MMTVILAGPKARIAWDSQIFLQTGNKGSFATRKTGNY